MGQVVASAVKHKVEQAEPPPSISITKFNILNCMPDNVLIELAQTCAIDLGVSSKDSYTTSHC